jgi:hypothetical protein
LQLIAKFANSHACCPPTACFVRRMIRPSCSL